MENPGIDPGTSRMLSGRSTIWANSPCLIWRRGRKNEFIFHLHCHSKKIKTVTVKDKTLSLHSSCSIIVRCSTLRRNKMYTQCWPFPFPASSVALSKRRTSNQVFVPSSKKLPKYTIPARTTSTAASGTRSYWSQRLGDTAHPTYL